MSPPRLSTSTRCASMHLWQRILPSLPRVSAIATRTRKCTKSGKPLYTNFSRRPLQKSVRTPLAARESVDVLGLGHACLSLSFSSRHGYTFRKDGHVRFIEYDLSIKQKAQHDIIQLKRPDVLTEDRAKADYAGAQRPQEESESESEGEGEDVWSEDDESETRANAPVQQLPKSSTGKVKTSRGRNERVMTPEEARAHLRRLFNNEAVICALLFGRHGPFAPLSPHDLSLASADMFFLELIPVTPTRFRPPAKMNDMLFEHPQNDLLGRILSTSYQLRDLTDSLRAAQAKGSAVDQAAQNRILQSLLNSLQTLQVNVNSFIDSSKNPDPVRQGKLPPPGVKQLLEKKEGLFRKHMMVILFCDA